MKPLLALLWLPTMIGVAGVAYADPDVAGALDPHGVALLDSLHAAGITYNREDRVIATAQAVCTLVASGKSGPEVLAVLRGSNPALTPEHAGQFLAIAMRSYCPEQLVAGDAGRPQ